jgi:hypothetical protein
MPSSVNITSPTSGANVGPNFTVSISYSNSETATAHVLLRCGHTGAHTQVVAAVGPGGSGSVDVPLTHGNDFTGATLEARLQLTQNWGDAFVASSTISVEPLIG